MYCPSKQSQSNRGDHVLMSGTYRTAGPWGGVGPSLGWLGYCWWCCGEDLICILVPIVTFYFLSSWIVSHFTLVHSAHYHPFNVINHHFWHHFLQPFTNDFPCADINKLISPDLLHQVIKGSFKDDLVTWVEEYLVLTHGRSCANVILDDINRW